MPPSIAYLSTMAALAGVLATSANAFAAPDNMNVVEVRTALEQCGYQLANGQPASRTQYVAVRDPGTADLRYSDVRIVMAIVYPDSFNARAAHLKAHRAAEERLGTPQPWSDDHGPQLLAGYGASVWRSNIAMVESTMRTLASMYSTDEQTGESRIARPDMLELGFVQDFTRYGVDWDFVACLDGATFPSRVGHDEVQPEPTLLPGRPW